MIDLQETTTSVSVQTPQSSEFESAMLSDDKIFVVLAVVLVIWAGIVIMLFRTDRKIAELERRLSEERKDV